MVRRAAFASAVSILVWLALPAVPAAAGGGCHMGVTQGSGTTVEMVDACFTPTVLYVGSGEEVAFVNRGDMAHNVTANQWGQFEDIYGGDAFRATFDAPGVYPFACSIHPGMSGAIVVGDGKGAGSGEAVTVEPLAIPETSTAPAEPASGAVLAKTPEPSGSPSGWLGGGVLGLAAGLGIGLTVRRRSGAEARRGQT